MHRRKYLALTAVTLAGCSSSGDGDTTETRVDTETTVEITTETATPTETSTTPPPAKFEFVSFDVPASVETGETFQVSFTVQNIGGQADTLETQVEIENTNTSTIVDGTVVALEAAPDETATWQSDAISVSEEATLAVRVPEFGAETEIDVAPWRNEQADEELEEAAGLLADAVEAYVSHLAPMRDLTEVTAAIEVNTNTVREPLYDARDILNDIEDMDLADDQRERLQAARGTYWFLWWLGSTHEELNGAYNIVSRTWGGITNEDYFGASTQADRIEGEIGDVEGELDKLTEDSDAGDMSAFDRLAAEDYQAKLDQIQKELEQFSTLAELLTDYIGAMETFTEAAEEYQAYSSDYQSASAGFYDAASTLDRLGNEFESTEWADSLTDIADEAVCIADALSLACEDLDTAAQAGADGNDSRQSTAEENAKDDFERCDMLREEFEIIQNFY